MALLAYHPERLAMLRRAVIDALVELDATRTGDPASTAAVAAVRASAGDLRDVVLPAVDRVLGSPAMTAGERRRAGIDQLEQSLVRVMANGYGWSVQVDQLADDTGVVTAEEARALGAMLARADGRALAADRDTLTWLVGQLALIATDPRLSRDFLANLRGWGEVADWLAWAQVLHGGGDPFATDPSMTALLDRVFSALAAVAWHGIDHRDTALTTGALVPDADEMYPYTVALLVQHLPLPDATLAAVATELLHRYLELPRSPNDGPWTDKDFDAGPNTADLLFPLLVRQPQAARRFVAEAAASDPGLLLATAGDQSLAHEVALVGSDPAVMPTAEAGETLLALLRGLDGRGVVAVDTARYGFDPDWHALLGALVAPWLVELGGLTTTWPCTDDERARLLAFTMQDHAALAALLARADDIVGTTATALRTRTVSLADVSATVGLLLQLFVQRQAREETVRLRQRELVWGLAGLVVGGAAGTLGDVAAAAGQRLVDGNGWLDMPDPRAAQDDAGLQRAWTLAVTAGAVATATFRRLVDDGEVDGSVPAPPRADPRSAHPDLDFLVAYERWKVDEGLDGTTAGLALDGAVLQFVNGAGAGEHLAELAD